MPKTNEDAIAQGWREGLRDLVRNLIGKGLFWVIIGAVLLWLAGIGLSYASDFLNGLFGWMNPLEWSWFGWFDEDQSVSITEPVYEPAAEVDKPDDDSGCGNIRTSKWYPGWATSCK